MTLKQAEAGVREVLKKRLEFSHKPILKNLADEIFSASQTFRFK